MDLRLVALFSIISAFSLCSSNKNSGTNYHQHAHNKTEYDALLQIDQKGNKSIIVSPDDLTSKPSLPERKDRLLHLKSIFRLPEIERPTETVKIDVIAYDTVEDTADVIPVRFDSASLRRLFDGHVVQPRGPDGSYKITLRLK